MIISDIHPVDSRINITTRRAVRGFSMIELVIVVVIILIMSAISLPYIYNYKKLYKTEDQSIKVMDLMREAAQLALTRRRTIRVEIDQTEGSPAIRLIDTGDVLIKSIPLEPLYEVRMKAAPAGVTMPDPPKYAAAAFAGNVWSARFRSDGSVVNAADIPISATLYSWPPDKADPGKARQLTEVRAITIFGGTGAVRYWKHDGTTFKPY